MKSDSGAHQYALAGDGGVLSCNSLVSLTHRNHSGYYRGDKQHRRNGDAPTNSELVGHRRVPCPLRANNPGQIPM